MAKTRKTLQVRKERAILVAAILRSRSGDDLAELTALAESAGAVVVDRFQQRLRSIHPATYVGKGKAQELAGRVARFSADVVIFDNNLSPGQIRELEEVVRVKVLDRSELILDIFATRAQTLQAKLQVELAQLEYTYPRLTRMWSHLDTVAGAGGATAAGSVGAIGTRGPGEKQLEIDRRLVSRRILELKRDLDQIDARRLREIGSRRSTFKLCLVGYTNAGKSSLLNALTDAGVSVEDRLFATLDTRTRQWSPQRGVEVLVSDTVGFVRDLPHQLVESFKATLEEAVHADLLLHVIDVSNPEVLAQIESVDRVLAEIGCQGKSTVKVLNKADAVQSLDRIEVLQTIFPDALTVSAKTGMGLDRLGQVVCQRVQGGQVRVHITAGASDGRLRAFLQAQGRILEEIYVDGKAEIQALVGRNQVMALQRFRPVCMRIMDE
ncbi:MAG: GTPase HflX [Phycisphaerae bacterium]|nr:GTPase HflX [Phycisphaerae bacterium]